MTIITPPSPLTFLPSKMTFSTVVLFLIASSQSCEFDCPNRKFCGDGSPPILGVEYFNAEIGVLKPTTFNVTIENVFDDDDQPDDAFTINSVLALDNRGITSIAPGGLDCSSILEDAHLISAVDFSFNNFTVLPTLEEILVGAPACSEKLIMTVDFNHNQITSVPADYFVGGTCDYINLLLDYNEIDDIDGNVFQHCYVVCLLYVSDNLLTAIPKGLFTHGQQVAFVARNNLLTELPQDTFDGWAGDVLWIDVSNNTISSLPDQLFGPITQGQLTFRIEHNGLKTLGNDIFLASSSASFWLHMGHNKLTTFTSATLGNLTSGFNLQQFTINMEHNEISTVPADIGMHISGQNFFIVFDFRYNGITRIGNDTLAGFEDVQDVLMYFEYNAITVIEIGAFTSSANLAEIYLGWNKLTTLPQGLLNLEYDMYLNVTHNQIIDIPNGFLADFAGGVVSVDMSFNKLTSLPILGEMSVALLFFNVNNNQIATVRQDSNNGSLLSNTRALTCSISLRYNSLDGVGVARIVNSYSPDWAGGYPSEIAKSQFTLDVSHNKVTEIPTNTFVQFVTQKDNSQTSQFAPAVTVNMSYNPVKAISESMFGTYDQQRKNKKCAGWRSFDLDVGSTIGSSLQFPSKIIFRPNNDACVAREVSQRHLTLRLAKSGVNSTVIGAFVNFTKVQLRLDLQQNNISSLDGSNQSLSNANIVNLSHNRVTTLPSNLLPSASTIDLSYNAITAINNNTFNSSIYLKNISLCCNEITYVASQAFGIISSIENIDLSNNKLKIISSKLASSLPFTRLNLQNNTITTLPETNNRVFTESTGSSNILTCQSYTPNLRNCTCNDPKYKYFTFRCSYGICSQYLASCGSGKVASQNCVVPNKADARVFECISNCSAGFYLSRISSRSEMANMQITSQTGVCIPLSDCSKLGTLANGTIEKGYQTRPETTTTDRVCYPCTSCDENDHQLASCSKYNDTICAPTASSRNKLKSGGIAGIVVIVLVVSVLVIVLAFWGKLQSKNLQKRTVSLEMTERLLGEEEASKLQQEQSYMIEYRSVKLFEILGQGANGVVKSGEWLGSKVAVKLLLPGKMMDTHSLAFEKEMKAMRALHHPNLCAFFGFGTSGKGQPFLVTELMNGTLRQKLHEDFDSLTWVDNRRMLSDIVAGMLFLHTRNPPMIHRDLKSDNCLFGDNNIIKIADFGTCIRPGMSGSNDAEGEGERKPRSFSTLKMTASLGAGTPLWMAPEVMVGKYGLSKYGPSVDVYSFGMVMYEIASGQLPYYDLSYGKFQFTDFVCDGGRPTLQKNLDIPDVYKDLMWKCWHNDADSRPSFEQIRSQLQKQEFGGNRSPYSYAH